MSTRSADEPRRAGPAPAPTTSFATDIVPILAPYRENMMWRLDLVDYEAVKANRHLIYQVIKPTSGNPMPPPPLPPIASEDVATFRTWMSEKCPR